MRVAGEAAAPAFPAYSSAVIQSPRFRPFFGGSAWRLRHWRMSTKNSGALARARMANNKPGSFLRRSSTSKFTLDDADDKIALVGNDLSTAVEHFIDSNSAKLMQHIMPEEPLDVTDASAMSSIPPPAPIISSEAAAVSQAARTKLLAALDAKVQEANEGFTAMRGLLHNNVFEEN